MNLIRTPAPSSQISVSDDFLDLVRKFDEFGRRTEELKDAGNARISLLVNEFWTARQRRGHPLHEISYRACFKAELPAFFIEHLSQPGEIVHDPFMGRGTSPVQAALMGRVAFGSDISPLSEMLARPRLCPVDAGAVEAALATVNWQARCVMREDLLVFYHPRTLKCLEALRSWIAERMSANGLPDPVADWIRMVALSRLSGHSSGFFSGRSMPPNQAVSVKAQRRINAQQGVFPPERDVPGIILRKTKSLLRSGGLPAGTSFEVRTGLAWSSPWIKDASVALVVTSPPFLDVVQYAADNWLRCWFAGIDAEGVTLSICRNEKAWTEMVRKVFIEQARILRSGGYVAFEVGEVRGGKVLLERLVWQAAEGLPFERLGVMVNDQEFTKTSHTWGIANGARGTNTNRIVLLRRH